MNTFIKRALIGTLLAGGITLCGATVANAAETTGEDGLLSGNQALIDVSAPVSIVGNAVSLIGDSTVIGSGSASEPASAPESAPVEATTSGEDGIGSGNQAIVDVSVPVTVEDNAVSVIGDSTVVNPAPAEPAAPVASSEPVTEPVSAPVTSGEDGILSGNQLLGDIDVPVNISGNAVSVIGDSTVVGGASHGTSGGGDTAAAPVTSGEDGILSGNQLIPVIDVPVNISGNAVSVIGDSTVVGGAGSGHHGTTGGDTWVAPVTSGETGSSAATS